MIRFLEGNDYADASHDTRHDPPPCPYCGGDCEHGRVCPEVVCANCEGEGVVTIWRGASGEDALEGECPDCNGEGWTKPR